MIRLSLGTTDTPRRGWVRRMALALTLSGVCAAAPARPARAQDAVAAQAAPRPGDIVRLRIWREPDMSGEFTVNEVGDVVLPKLGATHVAAMSADSLRRHITAAYGQILRDPSIDVVVLRRVKVLGAVRNPGLYPIDATMTLGDVVALAGGPTSDGDRKAVRLTRAGETRTMTLARSTPVASTPLRSGDQIEVPERGWLSRNGALVASVAGTAGLVFATLIRR